MTPNDINNDDEFDENFDVEEDFDDGPEEDWDDEDVVDDIPDMPGTETSNIADTADSPEIILPAGEKTFVQKFFMPIVVGVVALFGLLFVVSSGLLSGSDSVEMPAAQETQIVDTQQKDASPSADEPMIATKDELPDLPIEANNAPPPEGPLTPLPGDESAAKEETFELVDLEAELQDGVTDVILDEAPALIDSSQDNTPLKSSVTLEDTTDIIAVDVLNVDAENITAIQSATPMPTPEEAKITDISALTETTEPKALLTAENKISETSAISPVSSSENDSLKLQIVEGHETIEALRQELAALKATVEETPAVQQIEEIPTISMDTKADASAVVDVIKETKQEAAKVVSTPIKKVKPRKAKKAIKWVLRSAQPGKATIAQVGSSDMRTVEIGQTISGLGRIRAIQIENGLWVVRGTKNSVSQ